MKKIQLPKSLLVLLVAPAMLALVLPTTQLLAQSQTETKIRLMSDGLRARDSGDLEAAKKDFEELLTLAPNDVTVQRLLGGVNTTLAARAAAPAAAVATATPATATPVATEPVEVTLPKPGAVAKVQTPEQAASAQADLLAKQENQRLKEVAAQADLLAKQENQRKKAAAAQADLLAKQESQRVKTAAAQAAAQVDMVAKQENQKQKSLIAAARAKRDDARSQVKEERFDDAIATFDAAIKILPVNPATTQIIADFEAEKNGLLLQKAQFLLRKGDTEGARSALEAYSQVASSDANKANSVARSIDHVELTPPMPLLDPKSKFVADQKEIAKLNAKGRSQYLAGDSAGAQETFRLVESIDSGNAEAKSMMARIANENAQNGVLNREKTRAQMVEEVAKSWQRPAVYLDPKKTTDIPVESKLLAKKLNAILLPSVNFTGVELNKVVSTLTNLTVEYDKSEGADKGINIMLLDPSNKNPPVNITIKSGTTLKRTLDFITESIGYQYEIQTDAVVIRPGGETTALDTVFFPVNRATVTRMTGMGSAAAAATPATAADPFAATATAGAAGGGGAGGESQSLKAFLQQAGVDFDGTPKSNLVYDGAAIIVTQTSRNVERIRNILNRYNDVKQVEIETKFMEVAEGALDELGVNWSATNTNANNVQTYGSANRSLSGAFSGATTSAAGAIVSGGVTTPITDVAPTLPGGSYLATASSGSGGYSNAISNDLAVLTHTFGAFNVQATIRALSQKSGTDLLSAPKVTVLSGNSANIVIAQEMRYPQSYGAVTSTPPSGNATTSAIAITAGTPQEFTMRNVGVELKVTPTVEEDDYSISLDLAPKVTEFEGFIEYGGQSIAISGTTSVTVPSGFFQPIFSTREITTKVTVWDGATLVMGGLTREEVKKTSDKVPVLGDIPFIGRAFRSKGETTQKRNLLIFVTANLVSPGGSPKKQQLKSVAPSSMFQNPTMVTPASSESRVRAN